MMSVELGLPPHWWTLTNSKLMPHLLRLSTAMVLGCWIKVSAACGSGPRGFPERSRSTREYCMFLFCFIQLAKREPPEGGGGIASWHQMGGGGVGVEGKKNLPLGVILQPARFSALRP